MASSTVLARKYRPQVFDDLLGQEALVQTITNGIQQNKLAQAYLLTGIRGIGRYRQYDRHHHSCGVTYHAARAIEKVCGLPHADICHSIDTGDDSYQ